MDIVERLRACHGIQSGDPDCCCTEAADEIKRLEELLWQEAGNRVEIERLHEWLRGIGTNRYWEERWRDEKAENERLWKLLEFERSASQHEVEMLRAEIERLTAERDVWKIACNAQADEVKRLRGEVKKLRQTIYDECDPAAALPANAKIIEEVSAIMESE